MKKLLLAVSVMLLSACTYYGSPPGYAVVPAYNPVPPVGCWMQSFYVTDGRGRPEVAQRLVCHNPTYYSR